MRELSEPHDTMRGFFCFSSLSLCFDAVSLGSRGAYHVEYDNESAKLYEMFSSLQFGGILRGTSCQLLVFPVLVVLVYV